MADPNKPESSDDYTLNFVPAPDAEARFADFVEWLAPKDGE